MPGGVPVGEPPHIPQDMPLTKRVSRRPPRYLSDNEDGEEVEKNTDEGEVVSEAEAEYRAAKKYYMGSWRRRKDKLEAYMKTEEQYVEPAYEYEYNVRLYKKANGRYHYGDRRKPSTEDFKEADKKAFLLRRQERREAADCVPTLTDDTDEKEYYEDNPFPAKLVHRRRSVPFLDYMQQEIRTATYGLDVPQRSSKKHK
jgi:hypothetical protein